ncbi:MFS transporter [Chengkuizengella axinellae]|uniref:MFS transporter n=1 Tax=Chengkuizengella axinellae TaxID=3064388 RepID=A0ABT9IXH9_9BACL|nr:MFS transporter [Chengkuizengella sp. 2205SS18-9]MDP5273943.1 MFS transporter [Chengkuizengella sp. 2205SS18-9]
MTKTFSVFKNGNYTKLFLANLTSHMGTVIGLTAFMFYLLDRFTNQPIYATINEMMYSLPTLFVFLLIGVFADRMDRQKIAVYSDWIRAILSICFLAAIWIGWIPLIFFIIFLRSAVQKFFFPAEQAMVQGILKEHEYTTAAGLNQMVNSLFMLFGSALGAVAYWTVGIEGAIIVDTISFVISALLLHACNIPESVRLPNGKKSLRDLQISMVLKDFREGMIYILGNRLLLSLIVGFIVFGIVNGGFSVILIFMLKYELAKETYEQMSVILGIIFGIGVLIGSIFASIIAQKVKLYKLAILGLLMCGLITALSVNSPSIIIFFSLLFVVGLFLPFINVALGGWIPKIVDPKMMGRVQGWLDPLTMLAQTITLGVIAVTYPTIVKIEGLYWLVGGCLMIVAIFYAIVLPKYEKQHTTNLSKQKVQEEPSV